jgi:biotin carboxylase
MTEHVLVVGGGMEMPTLLRELGDDVRTTVMCQLPILPKLREPGGHQRVLGLRAAAPTAEWLALARAAHATDPFTRLASFGERDQDRAAAIGEDLGLATHSTRTIEWVHHKPSMRARLAECGLDDTPYAVVGSEAELRSFVDAHGYPCILKPAVGAGSIGVSRLGGPGGLAAALSRATAGSEWTRGGALVERLHEGPQFSVEAFTENGVHEVVCCTRKFSTRGTHVEVGHVLPVTLGDDVVRYVRAVLSALDIRFGPTHTELACTGAGPRVIETHTRLAGDRIPYLVRDALGVDLVALTVRQALGENQLLTEVRDALARNGTSRYAAIWYAGAATTGTLTAVSGAESAAARDGVVEVGLECAVGQPVAPPDSSDARLAYVRAHAATPGEAVRVARGAAAALEFSVR